MEEQLIEFKTAKTAKEVGFNEKTPYIYVVGHENTGDKDLSNFGKKKEKHMFLQPIKQHSIASAPTQSLLQKWLRDVHNCFVEVVMHTRHEFKEEFFKDKEDFNFFVEVNCYGNSFQIIQGEEEDFYEDSFSTYEEALETGLYQALELIKQ